MFRPDRWFVRALFPGPPVKKITGSATGWDDRLRKIITGSRISRLSAMARFSGTLSVPHSIFSSGATSTAQRPLSKADREGVA